MEWARVLESLLGVKVRINHGVLRKVEERGCRCLCKFRVRCPCKESVEEVRRWGKCWCGLYVAEGAQREERGFRIRWWRRGDVEADYDDYDA